MTIYIIIIIALLLSLCFPKKSDKKITFFISTLLIIVAVIRGESVGTDIRIYDKNFFHTTLDTSTWSEFGDTFEPGFSFLIGVYRTFISYSDNLSFYGFCFLTFFFGFLYFIRINNYPVKLSLFFFVLLGFYPMAFNIMRQFFAIGLFLFLSAKPIKNRQYIILFLLILFITYFFHRSSLVLLGILPILYLSDKRLEIGKIWYILLVVCSFLLILFKDQILGLMMSMTFILNLFSSNEERYITYLELSQEMGYLTSLMQSLFCIFLIWISPKKMLNRFDFLMYFFGIILYNIVSLISGVAVRFPIAYLLFSTMFFPILWSELQGKKKNLYKTTVILYSLIYFIFNYLVLNKGEVTPYVTRFD